MLPQNLIDECEEIKERHERFKHSDKAVSIGILIVLISLLASGLFYTLNLANFSFTREISIVAVIILVITFIITIIKARKLKKLRISETERVILYAYRAFLYLDMYLQKGVPGSRLEHLSKAKEEIQKIVSDIVPGWRDYNRYNSLIPNLDPRIGTFVENISKLEPAIENIQISKKILQDIMLELITFLLKKNDFDVDYINKVFLPLKSTPPKLTIEERIKIKIIESLQKNSIRIHIAVSGGLPAIGFLTWWILTQMEMSQDTRIVVVTAMSLVPLIMYWIYVIKDKLR